VDQKTDQPNIIATQVIEDVVNKSDSDRILVSDLVEAMETIGFGFVMTIFSLCAIVPLPPPAPSIMALPLVIFSAQLMLGYQAPKLPKVFAKRSVKRSTVAMLVQKSSPYLRKIERILRPRLSFMISNTAERVIGFLSLVFSLFVLLPMPLSNFIPGLGILIISLGLLGKDGLFVICGMIVGLIGAIVSIAVILLGVEALNYLKNFFF
jgi:hypothetical protein